MTSPPKIPLQLQRQRQERHTKLMKMINSYELSRQQKAKLQKIKSHTMMQINLRYLRSEINRNYKFPKLSKSTLALNSSEEESYLSAEDNDEEEDRILKEELQQAIDTKGKVKKRAGQYFVYDLRSQNEQKKEKLIKETEFKPFSTKILSLQQSRRVHSLGNEKSQQKSRQDLIIRRHNPIKNSNERFAKSPPNLMQTKSTKSLKTIKPISQTRRSSKNYLALEQSIQKSPHSTSNSKNLLVDSRKLKLPEINSFSGNSRSLKKLNPLNHEKLKTQKMYEEEDIQYAIEKKLVTEAADSGKKAVKGIQKYLKELQAEKQQIFMNSQVSRGVMKKQKDQDKKRLNLDLFKTTKNSLKREIQ